jgi:hypothetical protein
VLNLSKRIFPTSNGIVEGLLGRRRQLMAKITEKHENFSAGIDNLQKSSGIDQQLTGLDFASYGVTTDQCSSKCVCHGWLKIHLKKMLEHRCNFA